MDKDKKEIEAVSETSIEKVEETTSANQQHLTKNDSLIMGNWFKNLRLQNKQMEMEVIEDYLGLKEGELHLIEEGVKEVDYITINKLIGIYCADLQTDSFQYIMKNINNSLPMINNSSIINKALDKTSLNIKQEGKFKIIEISEKELIKIWKEEDIVVVNVRCGDITLEEQLKIDHEHYQYKSLLDNIMVIYRKLYYDNIRSLIINKSHQIQKNVFIDKLFEEL